MGVRRAVDDDWQASRAIRLHALQDAPLAFASTYAREAVFGEDVWRDRIADSAQFLAFDGDAVVGTATGFVDPAEPTAVRLVAMFVVPLPGDKATPRGCSTPSSPTPGSAASSGSC